VRAVIDNDPEFAPLRIDFAAELEATLQRLMLGWSAARA